MSAATSRAIVEGIYLKRFGFKYFKAMYRMAFILLMVVCLVALGLSSCTKVGEQPTAKGPTKELPLAEYRDTTILDMYEGSRLSWVLKTKYLVKWPRTEMVKAKPVNLIVYDTLGKVLVTVTSDSGSVDEGISFLVASGHVHGRSEKGVDITSDSLRWNKAINQISTDARVRVISEDGDILTGKGFISDAKLDNWQILSDVKGVFQKVEERFQNADSASPAPSAPPSSASGSSPSGVAPGAPAVDTAQPPAASPPATPAAVAPAAVAPAAVAPAPAAPASPSVPAVPAAPKTAPGGTP